MHSEPCVRVTSKIMKHVVWLQLAGAKCSLKNSAECSQMGRQGGGSPRIRSANRTRFSHDVRRVAQRDLSAGKISLPAFQIFSQFG